MEKIAKAKVLHCPEKTSLDWEKYHTSSSDFLENCLNAEESIDRRCASRLSVEEFRMAYESANRPLVIENGLFSWPALSKWSLSVESK